MMTRTNRLAFPWLNLHCFHKACLLFSCPEAVKRDRPNPSPRLAATQAQPHIDRRTNRRDFSYSFLKIFIQYALIIFFALPVPPHFPIHPTNFIFPVSKKETKQNHQTITKASTQTKTKKTWSPVCVGQLLSSKEPILECGWYTHGHSTGKKKKTIFPLPEG